MTPPFNARAQADEVLIALSILDIDACSTTGHPVVARIEPTDPDHDRWMFMLTPRGWSTFHSRDGVRCEQIYGYVDRHDRDAAPSVVAQAIRNQLLADAVIKAAGEVQYLRCRQPE